MRALFKLKRLLYKSNMTSITRLKVFEQLIQAICLYCSGILGDDYFKTTDSNKFKVSMEKLTCAKLNISFFKFVLGTHKKSL